jgi:hypothetical protein
MLNFTGTHYTIEIQLGRYSESLELLASLDLLETNYAAAADDAARIVIQKQMLDIYRQLLHIFLLERN